MNVGNWTRQSPAVWDHESGLRLHIGGFLRPANSGDFIAAFRWPESQVADYWIRVAGGNQKRGLMLWALNRSGRTA